MTSPPSGGWARDMEVVGYSALDERPAFKLAMQEAGGRWYLYCGHLWHRGWTVADVTDPTSPRVVRFVAGPDNTWTCQVQVAAGTMITALERIAPAWGGDPARPHEAGVMLWDVAQDPETPRLVGRFETGGSGTHRNYYDGGRYLHLAAGLDGWVGNIYLVVDIADRARPKEVARWWVPGQWRAGGESAPPPHTSLHGGPWIEGDRAYLPYSGAGLVILDVSEPTAPRPISQLMFSPPFPSWIAVHTAMPLPDRGLVWVNSEAIAEDCAEPVGFAGLVDVADERHPRFLSYAPLPAPPPGSPWKNFCERGGRFGPHNVHQPQHQPALQPVTSLVYLTYFNAGLRVVDIGDPRLPREVGWFVPPDPGTRRGRLPTKLVAQSEDVLVDARGYVYLSDKNHGLYVLRYTGAHA
jgi:hypothetical protein